MVRAEELLIRKFVVQNKQERYLTFLAKEKTRKKFKNQLYHFNDFKWNLFRNIGDNENPRMAVASKLNSNKNISTCSIISVDRTLDGKLLPADEAMENAIGVEGTILIFGEAEIVYYESEAPKGKFVSV